MRLSIRWQLALVSVALALLPMAIIGVIAYRSARGALEERIRFNLETLASLTAEKLDRLLLDRQQNLRGLSQLGFVQDDTVTGDADARILQFLQQAKRGVDLNQELWVANAAGTVIASTMPGLQGREVGDQPWLQAARHGETWTGTPEMQPLTGRVGMPLAFPILASFDRAKTVGVPVAVLDWSKIVEILHSIKVLPEGQDERGYMVLVDARGVILSAPPFLSGWEPGKTRINSFGLEGLVATTAGGAPAGSAILTLRDASYLMGYATTEGNRTSPLPGALSWSCAPTWRSHPFAGSC